MGGFHVIGHEGKSESLVLSSLFPFLLLLLLPGHQVNVVFLPCDSTSPLFVD